MGVKKNSFFSPNVLRQQMQTLKREKLIQKNKTTADTIAIKDYEEIFTRYLILQCLKTYQSISCKETADFSQNYGYCYLSHLVYSDCWECTLKEW